MGSWYCSVDVWECAQEHHFFRVPRVSPYQGSAGMCSFIVNFWSSHMHWRMMSRSVSPKHPTGLCPIIHFTLHCTRSEIMTLLKSPGWKTKMLLLYTVGSCRTQFMILLWTSSMTNWVYIAQISWVSTCTHITAFSTPSLCFILCPSFVHNHSSQQQHSILHTSFLQWLAPDRIGETLPWCDHARDP